MRVSQPLALTLSFFWATCVGANIIDSAGEGGKPNFVFIITDDQDAQLNSLEYQPLTLERLGNHGTRFQKHYCTIAICCPSRVSLLTGKMAHNTNVTDVSPPYGGYPKFIAQGLNDAYLPVWLQNAGYNTFYTGKLMNAHSVATYNKPFPNGWNGTGYLIDPGTYIYYNTTWQAGTEPPRSRPGEYSTDIVANTALGFIEEASQSARPFFVGIAPIAPHTQTSLNPGASVPYFTLPVPATRHQGLFAGVRVPRSPSFNPDEPSSVSWINQLPFLNSSEIEYIDTFYQARIQALQAVDELVGNVIDRLESLGVLENTYVIYTSDNGFHMGQHRLQPGKTCALEEDVNVPFLVRGPGVPKNQTVDVVTSHTDIVPTLFELAGIPLRSDFDGSPIPLTTEKIGKAAYGSQNDHVTIEFWGEGIAEGRYAATGINGSYTTYPNNTYKAVRVINQDYSLFYSVWCTNEHELYDVKADPHQLNNLYNSPTQQWSGQTLPQLSARLDALLLVLKSCQGATCTTPWKVLHPQDDVHNLRDALDAKYNAFYQTQPRITFSKCELGYIVSSEGVQDALSYQYIGD